MKKKRRKKMEVRQKVLEKEIDLIQGCINRMAQNSFVVKGWLITLVTVVLALLSDKINIDILCAVIILATFLFWYLDAFFLRAERLFRWKYDWVIKQRLLTDDYKYDLNPKNEKMWLPTIKFDKENKPVEKEKKAPSVIRIMFTKTLWPLYGFIIIFALFILLNNHFNFIPLVNSTPEQQKDLQVNILSFLKQ